MADPENPGSTTDERVLLPSHVVPIRYDLSIQPDLVSYTFAGECVIELKVDPSQLGEGNRAKEITLHSKELGFLSAKYEVSEEDEDAGSSIAPGTPPRAGAVVKADEIRVNLPETTVTFAFPTPIPSSTTKLVMTISYFGILNNQMAGFYRSTYTDIDGKTKVMGSTQFEALDARRAFPCVDEPAAKAIFGVALTIPTHLTCFSNMPEKSVESLSRDLKRVTFLDSPLMSTYLLAFCVGEFDCVQQLSKGGVLVKVYTPPGKSGTGHFALDCAVQCLDHYDAFFQEPYPLPKLDMVAIPEFAMGAMENWGLVTYREVDLLIDSVKASNQQKQRVAVVVAHELAHQWFGNLVTMQWWNGLWLNESFASWCENWAVDKIYPEYRMWDQFTTGHFSSALRLDALRSSHPIEVPIKNAEEVEQVFDAISYCKGATVVRMIKAVLGMKNFQSGLAAYMKKHAYGNTETSDLWRAWEASGMPIGELMASWTEQMGFPLLRVVKEDWQADKVTLELEQSWFLSDGSALGEAGAKKLWTIPIFTCSSSGMQDDMTLMREKHCSITIPTTSWVKLNADQQVPIRVLPGPEMLKRLSTGIQEKTLGPIDRAGLLNDAYALVKSGNLSPESIIELLVNYKKEDNYIVWEALSQVLGGLDAVLSDDTGISSSFRKFAKGFALQLLEVVGWDAKASDGHLTTLLRGIMVDQLSSYAFDDPEVSREARTRFQLFQNDHNDVNALPSDMRVQVFNIYLKNGGQKEYDDVKSYFYSASDNAERKHVLSSLGNTPDPKLKLATMEWTTSGEVKLQDMFYAMGSVCRSNREGREISWKYFQNNFDKIHDMLKTAAPALMGAAIVMCAGGFCSNQKADEIEAFFASHPLPKCSLKISQTVEAMRTNAKFLSSLKASQLSDATFWDQL